MARGRVLGIAASFNNEFSPFNFLGQRHGLCRGQHPKLALQCQRACPVAGQRRIDLAVEAVQPHDAAQVLLAPGFQFEISQCRAQGLGIGAGSRITFSETRQDRQDAQVQSFSLDLHPLFKIRAIRQAKATQKLAGIAADDPLHLLKAKLAVGLEVRLRARVIEIRQRHRVDLPGELRVQSHGLPLHQQRGSPRPRLGEGAP